jgi:hypothetical protein
MLEKKGFCSRAEDPFELYGLSVSGDRRFGKRSSSMRPLRVLENAMFEDYIVQALARIRMVPSIRAHAETAHAIVVHVWPRGALEYARTRSTGQMTGGHALEVTRGSQMHTYLENAKSKCSALIDVVPIGRPRRVKLTSWALGVCVVE